MRHYGLVLGGSVLLCLAGVGTIVLLELLGKDGWLDGGRFAQGKLGPDLAALALLSSPLLTLAALCYWWRHGRWIAAAGLLAAGVSFGITAWGNLSDYLAWSRRPPPTDQVTYLGGFVAMLGSWGVCLVYGVVGLLAWFQRRWRLGQKR